MTPCPLCGAAEARPLFEKDGVPYERCVRCGLPTRGGPESPPSYHDYLPDATRTLPPLTHRRYEELIGRLARFRSTGRFLDVGCGGGFLVEAARDLGWDAVGTEVSRAAVEFGRERGLDLRHGTLIDTGLDAGAYDVITLMEVVEHVPDPVGLLRQAADLLRPGGALYLTTPNWNSLSRRVLGAAWHPIGRDHVVYLAPWSIRRALRAAGLRPLRVTSANVQPHEIRAHLFGRRRPAPQTSGAAPAPSYMDRTLATRDRIESSALLRAAKSAVNAALSATGTGDTLRALAVRD